MESTTEIFIRAKKLESQRRIAIASLIAICVIIVLTFIFPERITAATSDIIQTGILGLFSITGIWMGLEGWLIQKGPQKDANGST